jgi:hypothetical protein
MTGELTTHAWISDAGGCILRWPACTERVREWEIERGVNQRKEVKINEDKSKSKLEGTREVLGKSQSQRRIERKEEGRKR